MKNYNPKPEEFKAGAEKCALEIICWLLRHEMWIDTCIYANGKRFTCYDGDHYQYDNTWDCVFVEEDMDPHKYVEYCGDFLTMTFEGPLYDVINYSYPAKLCDPYLDELNEICNKYKKYWELGYSWSLSLYDSFKK
jgi:hypothetical protein